MNNEIYSIAKRYSIIKESENISNNMSGKDVSTRFQTDNTAKFLPVGQDKENALGPEESESELMRGKVELLFKTFKSIIDSCQTENCSVREVSKLIDLLDDPEVRNDLEQYKLALQREDQDNGVNSKLAY
jgi:hypothetical protein